MATETSLVTRIHLEHGVTVRASEDIDNVATLIASPDDGWFIVQDPGTGNEQYVLASRVLWLSQENEA